MTLRGLIAIGALTLAGCGRRPIINVYPAAGATPVPYVEGGVITNFAAYGSVDNNAMGERPRLQMDKYGHIAGYATPTATPTPDAQLAGCQPLVHIYPISQDGVFTEGISIPLNWGASVETDSCIYGDNNQELLTLPREKQ